MVVRSVNPRTGQVIKEFASNVPEDVSSALAKGREAQRKWMTDWNKDERIEAVLELRTALQAMKDDMIATEMLEGGFPQKDVIGTYNGVIKGFDHYSAEARATGDYDFPLDPTGWPDTKATINLVPHGVIAHIGIWNYPLWQTMITLIPALMAGNAVVFKPSELTTMTGLKIKEAFGHTSMPPDLFQVLVGGADIGKAMVTAPFDALVFTGGRATGLDITRNAGIKPMVLELSGNDPGIVCSDANAKEAARGVASGAFSHGGQVCIRIKRLYVVESVADAFIPELLKVVAKIDVEHQIGPLIREEARTKVHEKVHRAVHDGCELLTGGDSIPGLGYFFEPTILKVSDDRLDIIKEETFGPVLPIHVVKDEEEAIRLANDSDYGLGATVWTCDPKKGEAIAKRLEAGNVWINEHGRTINCGELFQGWKCSGIPSTNRRITLFMKKRTIVNHQSCQARAHWFK
ncbi:MAG: Lactaldehyde dehydrogenase [Methanomassiliicoccales archaeon PtaB.Bin215]|nr:MAG: Lactaldehyde dehydrogenase [Methanomassiliicoccales archaeon PtaB.Bin215]